MRMSAEAQAATGPALRGEERDRLLARVVFEASWERLLDGDTMRWKAPGPIFGYSGDEPRPTLTWWRERVHPGDRSRIEQTFAEATRRGAAVWSGEYRFRRKEGTWAWVWSRAAIERDAGGRALRAVGAMIDVTLLKQEEARLRLLVEQMPARAIAADRDLRVLWDTGAALSGTPNAAGKTVDELFAASPDRDRVLDACRRALAAAEPSGLLIFDGRQAAHWRLRPLRDSEGNVIGVIGAAFEVADRVHADSGLREARRILAAAQRVGKIRAWEEDLRTGLVTLDLSTADVHQRGREEVWKEIHPDDLARVMQLRSRTIEEGLGFEIEYRRVSENGAEQNILVRGELVRDAEGRPERIVGVSLDVTERVRAVEELRETQRLHRQVFDLLPVGVIVADRSGNVVLSNPASSRIWGGDVIVSGPERWRKSKGWWHGDGRPVDPDRWASVRALEKGETSRDELIDIETFDGRRRIIENYAAPVRDAQGAITGVAIVNQDVTERVHAEEELRKAQRLLVEAERLGQTGGWEQDLLTGRIVNTEGNLRVFFGDDRAKGARLEDYAEAVHPDDRERVMRAREALLAGTAGPEIEYRVVWPDGSIHSIHGLATVVRDQAGRPVRVYGTNREVTDRKRWEEELARRARQQAAVAQLSLTALRGEGLQPLFDEAVQLLAQTLPAHRTMLLESLPDRSEMMFRAIGGSWTGVTPSITLHTEPGFMTWFSLQAKTPVVVGELAAETRFVPCEVLCSEGVVSGISVPIPGKDRPYGVLGAHTIRQRTFTEDEVRFVWSMANVLATSIEQHRAVDELREKREQLHVLSGKLLEAQEAERRAVARELHDDFGQVLTAIKMNLMRKQQDQAESIALVDGAILRMRDLAHDLRPPLLDELGLDSSLRWYVEREATRSGLEFKLAFSPLPERPPPAVETTCFRVAQEALTNVIRHAHARLVSIELRGEDGGLVLVVRDDGTGFDVEAARRRIASQGLLGMQERVALVGGKLDVRSGPGGTTVTASLPFARGRR